jgi:hypothetical protein
MSGRIANTFPLTLKTVANSYPVLSGSIVRTDTYSTAGSTSYVTAPSNAAFARIRMWGGGGGGRGTNSIGLEYGGSGSGFNDVIIVVRPGQTSLNVTVGGGGSGGASGSNGASGGASFISPSGGNSAYFIYGDFGISVYGGQGGRNISSTGGGNAGGASEYFYDDGQPAEGMVYTSNSQNGNISTSSSGGNAGGMLYGGGAGGTGTSGAAGTAPGGGGAPNASGTGGAGGAGKIIIEWYGFPSSPKLRDYLPGAGKVVPIAIGMNGVIPSSGTIKLSDFRGANEVALSNGQIYYAYDYQFDIDPYGTATFYFRGNTSTGFGGTMADQGGPGTAEATLSYGSPWLRNYWGPENDVSIMNLVQVRRIHQGGVGGTTTVPSGSANNTWIDANTDPQWTLTATGNAHKSSWGWLELRWAANSQVFINCNSIVEVETDVDTCPTCCFTPDTLITMADLSTKRIDEVQSGDSILTFNHETGEYLSQGITGVIVRQMRPMHKYEFADGRVLNASEEHPLFVKNKGYAAVKPVDEYKDLGRAKVIEVGDLVIDQDGSENEIVSITEMYYPDDVYTLENSGFYANGMLVY